MRTLKLQLYAVVKTRYEYENYLNIGAKADILTKFRLSCHWLPIERGRYTKPKKARADRVCSLCSNGIGDEIHALFHCTNEKIEAIKEKSIKEICNVTNCSFLTLNTYSKLIYLLMCHDVTTTQILGRWLDIIDATYKESFKDGYK